jgi:hypothetical protein
MSRQTMLWPLGVAIGFLALIGVGASVAHYLQEPYNPMIPFSGWGQRVIIGLFGSLFLLALLKGFLHIRAGRVALHREWMIRAFAIALSIATIRLIYIPTLLIVADPTDAQNAVLWDTSFAVAFVVNTTVAELWIRATRRSGVPRARKVKAA